MSGGRLIVLEGLDASGKSTQTLRVAERLGALATREPGGTPLGRAIREMLLHLDVEPVPRAEALLFAADRAQHVETVVRPALDAGRTVVSDRSLFSSLAYQGHGRRLEVSELAEVQRWATGGLLPDLVVLLDLPWDEARRRLGGTRDRIERGDDGFHGRVRDGFAAMAAADPDRWVAVDAAGQPEEVTERIVAAVVERLPELGVVR